MPNASGRLLDIIKKTNVDTFSEMVGLTVTSINPFKFHDGDKLYLSETFVIFDSYIDTTKIKVGDKFKAVSLSGNQSYYITDIINSDEELDNYLQKISYSTSEQYIGRWIDNKKLYKKVIECELPTIVDGEFKTKTFGIGVTGYDLVFVNKAFVKSSSSVYPIPYTKDDGKRINAMISGSNISISSNSSTFSEKTAYVEICYTKT